MDSWQKVRGFQDWPVYAMIEPSPFQNEILDIFTSVDHPNLVPIVNSKRLGVLEAPYVGFEGMFSPLMGYDFVVRAEDDLLVSTDILEYFTWAANQYRKDSEIGAINAYALEHGPANTVARVEKFSPLVWGTWADRWNSVIGPTWDHDYSTHPGELAGWDWNIYLRVFPQNGLKVIRPEQSRVDNIGVYGVHATPENYQTSESFVAERPEVIYRERTIIDT